MEPKGFQGAGGTTAVNRQYYHRTGPRRLSSNDTIASMQRLSATARSDDVVGAHRVFTRSSPNVIKKLARSMPGVHRKMTERLDESSLKDAKKIAWS
ncbi:hypothetical protein BHM03_00019472 [Ensete ventricosum]|nr:hypothetical protein BHM03_00019472 [Ensete ventricosum]